MYQLSCQGVYYGHNRYPDGIRKLFYENNHPCLAEGEHFTQTKASIRKHGCTSFKHDMTHIQYNPSNVPIINHGAYCGPNRYPDGICKLFYKRITRTWLYYQYQLQPTRRSLPLPISLIVAKAHVVGVLLSEMSNSATGLSTRMISMHDTLLSQIHNITVDMNDGLQGNVSIVSASEGISVSLKVSTVSAVSGGASHVAVDAEHDALEVGLDMTFPTQQPQTTNQF